MNILNLKERQQLIGKLEKIKQMRLHSRLKSKAIADVVIWMKQLGFHSFTAEYNGTVYPGIVGEYFEAFIPQKRGNLSRFAGKTAFVVCVGSGSYRFRQYMAGPVKETKVQNKNILSDKAKSDLTLIFRNAVKKYFNKSVLGINSNETNPISINDSEKFIARIADWHSKPSIWFFYYLIKNDDQTYSLAEEKRIGEMVGGEVRRLNVKEREIIIITQYSSVNEQQALSAAIADILCIRLDRYLEVNNYGIEENKYLNVLRKNHVNKLKTTTK